MMLLLFSYRMKIERLFLEWCEENGVKNVPNSLVAFMHLKGWLNVEKIIGDLSKKEERAE